MSQHPSLRTGGVGGRHRNVLKRFERIKQLAADGKWDESKSVYNLPKVKSLKIKVKKVKEAKEEKATTAGAAPAAAPAAGTAKAAAPKAAAAAAPKAAAAAKPAAPKGK